MRVRDNSLIIIIFLGWPLARLRVITHLLSQAEKDIYLFWIRVSAELGSVYLDAGAHRCGN